MKVLLRNCNDQKINILVEIKKYKTLKKIRDLLEQVNYEVSNGGDVMGAIRDGDVSLSTADLIVEDLKNG